MKCPFCGFENDKVVDSRESKEGESIRRRRECLKCEKRFTTYERIDEIPYMVVKKDGRREKFERQKILAGLLRACEKRPISMGKMEQIVNEVEQYVIDSPERERTASELGEQIMNSLKQIDKVAYIRFASVYRDFKDVDEFHSELESLLNIKEDKTKPVKVQLWERLPRSETETLNVTVLKSEPELCKDPLYEREKKPHNILRWDLKVEPGMTGEKAIAVSFQFKVEMDKNMIIGGFLSK